MSRPLLLPTKTSRLASGKIASTTMSIVTGANIHKTRRIKTFSIPILLSGPPPKLGSSDQSINLPIKSHFRNGDDCQKLPGGKINAININI